MKRTLTLTLMLLSGALAAGLPNNPTFNKPISYSANAGSPLSSFLESIIRSTGFTPILKGIPDVTVKLSFTKKPFREVLETTLNVYAPDLEVQVTPSKLMVIQPRRVPVQPAAPLNVAAAPTLQHYPLPAGQAQLVTDALTPFLKDATVKVIGDQLVVEASAEDHQKIKALLALVPPVEAPTEVTPSPEVTPPVTEVQNTAPVVVQEPTIRVYPLNTGEVKEVAELIAAFLKQGTVRTLGDNLVVEAKDADHLKIETILKSVSIPQPAPPVQPLAEAVKTPEPQSEIRIYPVPADHAQTLAETLGAVLKNATVRVLGDHLVVLALPVEHQKAQEVLKVPPYTAPKMAPPVIPVQPTPVVVVYPTLEGQAPVLAEALGSFIKTGVIKVLGDNLVVEALPAEHQKLQVILKEAPLKVAPAVAPTVTEPPKAPALQVLTVPLFISPVEVRAALKDLFGDQLLFSSVENTLILKGTEKDLKEAQAILKGINVAPPAPPAPPKVEVVAPPVEVPKDTLSYTLKGNTSEIEAAIKKYAPAADVLLLPKQKVLMVSATPEGHMQVVRLLNQINFDATLDDPLSAENPSEPLQRTYPLKYARAEVVADVLNKLYPADEIKAEDKTTQSSKKTVILADKRTNTLLVNGLPKVHRDVLKSLQLMDTPTPSVKMKVRVEQVNTSALSDIGIQWGITQGGLSLGTLTGPLNVVYKNGGTAAFGLDMTLKALHSQGNGKSIVDSNFLIKSSETTSLTNGGTLVIPQAGKDSQGQTYEYGLVVDLTPVVNADGNVDLKVKVGLGDLPTPGPAGGVLIPNSTLESTISFKSGELVALGGVVSTKDTEKVSGIPVLMDIPLLGELFKTRTKEHIQQTLLIFITGDVVMPQVQAATPPVAPVPEAPTTLPEQGRESTPVGGPS